MRRKSTTYGLGITFAVILSKKFYFKYIIYKNGGNFRITYFDF